MNIFEAIRWLQDKPEGTELAAGKIRIYKASYGVAFEPVIGTLADLILTFEHADFRPVVDWSKVPVDTKVLVRDYSSNPWKKHHFARYEAESLSPFYTWMVGGTSWSETNTVYWKYCKLAEDDK